MRVEESREREAESGEVPPRSTLQRPAREQQDERKEDERRDLRHRVTLVDVEDVIRQKEVERGSDTGWNSGPDPLPGEKVKAETGESRQENQGELRAGDGRAERHRGSAREVVEERREHDEARGAEALIGALRPPGPEIPLREGLRELDQIVVVGEDVAASRQGAVGEQRCQESQGSQTDEESRRSPIANGGAGRLGSRGRGRAHRPFPSPDRPSHASPGYLVIQAGGLTDLAGKEGAAVPSAPWYGSLPPRLHHATRLLGLVKPTEIRHSASVDHSSRGHSLPVECGIQGGRDAGWNPDGTPAALHLQ